MSIVGLIARRRVRRRLTMGVRSTHTTSSHKDLVDSLNHIHRLVMSGASLDSSIAHAALIHPSSSIAAVHTRSTAGSTLSAACTDVIEEISRRKNPNHEERDSVIALHVLSVAGSIGGRIAEQIEQLIDVLDEREHLRRERRTHAASAAASMRLLTWLPVVCGAWMIVDSPAIREFLIGSPVGWTCLVLGIGSNLLGRMWLQREVSAC